MKLNAHQLDLTEHGFVSHGLPLRTFLDAHPAEKTELDARTAPSTPCPRRAAQQMANRAPWGSSIRLVGILAFCQSLLFLAFVLFVCAKAGAAPNDFDPKLKVSSYNPASTRDPFTARGVVVDSKSPVAEGLFRLQGILYQAANPSAIVNDQLVSLNKTVTLKVGNVAYEAKAIDITRERVTLEVGSQRVELNINSPSPTR